MEIPERRAEKKTFIETSTGNRVSRKAGLYGSQNIVLSGKVFVEPGCIIRGDLAHVRVGKYSVVKEGTVLRPSLKHFNKGVAFVPLSIGENCFIEQNCVVSAAQIGNFVHLGQNSVIGRRAVIKDCSILLADSVLPPDSVIPPFTIYGGAPARPVGKVAESHQDLMVELTTSFYQNTKLVES
jgi:dynactin-5